MVWVEDADHFFAGKLDQVQLAIRNWVQKHFHLANAS
jgi:alpha/beta superfamily hydrolase